VRNLLTGLVLADPNIDRNDTGLPGVKEAERIVGALLTYGVIAAIAGLAMSAIVWAIGGHSVNPQMAHRGKTGVIVSLAAAVLIGGADTLVQFFTRAGAGL
jgi:hypothetical protein